MILFHRRSGGPFDSRAHQTDSSAPSAPRLDPRTHAPPLLRLRAARLAAAAAGHGRGALRPLGRGPQASGDRREGGLRLLLERVQPGERHDQGPGPLPLQDADRLLAQHHRRRRLRPLGLLHRRGEGLDHASAGLRPGSHHAPLRQAHADGARFLLPFRRYEERGADLEERALTHRLHALHRRRAALRPVLQGHRGGTAGARDLRGHGLAVDDEQRPYARARVEPGRGGSRSGAGITTARASSCTSWPSARPRIP